MILLDTSGLLAAIDASQRRHAACVAALARARPPLILSPFVLAELDYLLATEAGAEAEAAWLGEVSRGVYRIEPFSAAGPETIPTPAGRRLRIGRARGRSPKARAV